MSNDNWQQKWGELVAKSWDDDKLRDRLLADPASVLKEHGIKVPAGTQVKVVQNTSNVIHLPLPPKPSSDEISEEELAAVAGGAQTCSITYFGKGASPAVSRENPAQVQLQNKGAVVTPVINQTATKTAVKTGG